MNRANKAWTEWKQERVELYKNLDTLADDLHSFHKESSKYVCGGTVAAAGGTALFAFGLIAGRVNAEMLGLGLQVAGRATVSVTQLLQEWKDKLALQTAAELLKKHETTHNRLKKMVEELNLTLLSLDYPLHYTPDMRIQNSVGDLMTKSAMLVTLVKSGKEKIIMSNLNKVTCVLNTITEIVQRDIPLFVRSWETMNGTRVPETVNRLRFLRNDLERQEDDLMRQFDELFCSKEFKTTLKRSSCY